MRNLVILLAAYSLVSAIFGASLMWAYLNPAVLQTLSDWLRSDCSETYTDPNQPSADKQQHAGDSMSVSESQKTTPPNAQDEQQKEENKTNRQIAKYTCQLATYTKSVARFTVWLVAVTGVLAFISLCGVYLSWSDTRILQRAYISAEPAGISPFLPRDLTASPTSQTLVGHVDFRNAGRLPARNVRWYADAEYTTADNYKPTRFGALIGNNIIPPGGSMTQGSIELTIPEGRLGYFYVWGEIAYDDGFGNDRKTIFCHRYNLRRLAPGKDGLDRIRRRYGRHHDKGNSTDDAPES